MSKKIVTELFLYAFAAIFAAIAIRVLASGATLPAILGFLVALSMLPQTIRKMRQEKKMKMSNFYIGIVVLIIIFLTSIPPTNSSEQTNSINPSSILKVDP